MMFLCRLSTGAWHGLIIFFVFFRFFLHSCDLNHDWKIESSFSLREIQPPVFLWLLEKNLGFKNEKGLVIGLSDLYKKEGKVTEDSLQLSERSTSSVQNLLMSLKEKNGKRIFFLNQDQEKLDLYEPENLVKLKRLWNNDFFSRIKIRSYSIVYSRSKDQYKRNVNMFRDARVHSVELTWAKIGVDGRYQSFEDLSLSYTEEKIWHVHPQNAEEMLIIQTGWSPAENRFVQIQNFLGLERVDLDGVNLARFVSSGLLDS